MSDSAHKKSGFHPVIDVGDQWNVLDLTGGYNPDVISLNPPSIGRYNEKRSGMYTTELFGGVRHIHVGLDIWVPAGTPVYAFADGEVLFFRDNNHPGDYGPTIVTRHQLPAALFRENAGKREEILVYALFGHLSRESLDGTNVTRGMAFKKGDILARVGDDLENGGWVPHLHFQLSLEHPAEPDMPGVVSEEQLEESLKRFPDPQLVLGRYY
ncbi:peptidoglycan DD-metalloendopeptidase family protein [Natronogracilivirga saccharolytica]|uniref:Peptidoglycan DD-metalloendopeptidase family protein n=1 Tax=Natronogracilivirga saccharolytica TaxID=2812953 RepID=A0A8J7RLQ8_9BACT|nr:peptidoglycan DD-metalloendopeptidase family protein [Natronogracilivirga saccharolytica]MBP3193672.1 peptidoglycan DD-metalloendopeptidase family protein [Natronogracilivirga saccharolytica]